MSEIINVGEEDSKFVSDEFPQPNSAMFFP